MAELSTIRNLLPGRPSAGIIVYRGISMRPAPSLPVHIAKQLEAVDGSFASTVLPVFNAATLAAFNEFFTMTESRSFII